MNKLLIMSSQVLPINQYQFSQEPVNCKSFCQLAQYIIHFSAVNGPSQLNLTITSRMGRYYSDIWNYSRDVNPNDTKRFKGSQIKKIYLCGEVGHKPADGYVRNNNNNTTKRTYYRKFGHEKCRKKVQAISNKNKTINFISGYKIRFINWSNIH